MHLPPELDKGRHGTLSHPYIFVDGCVQMWPDADWRKLNTCGCSAYCLTTWRPHDNATKALEAMAEFHRVADSYPEHVLIAWKASDIVEAKKEDKATIVLCSQSGDFLGLNLRLLPVFHMMGLRMMIPAYNHRNAICDGCLEPANAGLSRLGQRWVQECNRLGIVIDLTHVGWRSSLDIMERTQQPVVFSHSNPTRLVENPRNITDEQIKRCAELGGFVGATPWGPLNYKPGTTTRPTLEHFIDAIDYLADLVGIDHVGIGTDMSHGTYPEGDTIRGRFLEVDGEYVRHVEASPRSKLRYVEGFDDYSLLLNVVDALERRGYTRDDVEKVLGGNFLRVFAQVWGA